MAVEQIQAFRCSDGSVFTDEKEANDYEDHLKKLTTVKNVVSGFYYHGIEEEQIVEALMNSSRFIVKT